MNSNANQGPQTPPQAPPSTPAPNPQPSAPPPGQVPQEQLEAHMQAQAQQQWHQEFLARQEDLQRLAEKAKQDPVLQSMLEEMCHIMCQFAEALRTGPEPAQISEFWPAHLFQSLIQHVWAYGYHQGQYPQYVQNGQANRDLRARYGQRQPQQGGPTNPLKVNPRKR